jgi:hypothetical protein
VLPYDVSSQYSAVLRVGNTTPRWGAGLCCGLLPYRWYTGDRPADSELLTPRIFDEPYAFSCSVFSHSVPTLPLHDVSAMLLRCTANVLLLSPVPLQAASKVLS